MLRNVVRNPGENGGGPEIDARDGEEKRSVLDVVVRGAQEHGESNRAQDRAEDRDCATALVAVRNVGGYDSCCKIARIVVGFKQRVDAQTKATANGGTLISCARAAVYPTDCTIEGVKLIAV
jgi:hypothetical protein